MNIVSALLKAEEFLGGGNTWKSVNATQEALLVSFYTKRESLTLFTADELRALADTVAARLNERLKAEGFSIRLSDFGAGEFGMVSVGDISLEWLQPGGWTTLHDFCSLASCGKGLHEVR